MAYISTQDVKRIRETLKIAFPEFKFGVCKGPGSLSVDVTVKSGPMDFSDVLRDGYAQVNPYHLGNYAPEFAFFFREVIRVIKQAPANKWFDKSDSQSDYFHTAFYFHVNVGSWRQPYVYTPSKKEWVIAPSNTQAAIAATELSYA